MGGAWERLVQSVKRAIKTTLKEHAPRPDVLHTLFCEAEYTVNNRPLTTVSANPEEPGSLTPNHFLLGGSSGVTAPGLFLDTDLILRRQWRFAQRLADHFWAKWVREYLPTLNLRSKWNREAREAQIGDIVVIVDENRLRGLWLKGRVISVFPGRDGHVRVVVVKTQHGVFKRPVTKICVVDV